MVCLKSWKIKFYSPFRQDRVTDKGNQTLEILFYIFIPLFHNISKTATLLGK